MGASTDVRCRVCLQAYGNRAAATACYESHDPKCDWCGAPVEHLFSNECDAWREKRDAAHNDGTWVGPAPLTGPCRVLPMPPSDRP